MVNPILHRLRVRSGEPREGEASGEARRRSSEPPVVKRTPVPAASSWKAIFRSSTRSYQQRNRSHSDKLETPTLLSASPPATRRRFARTSVLPWRRHATVEYLPTADEAHRRNLNDQDENAIEGKRQPLMSSAMRLELARMLLLA